jgi:hypothetical protein
VVYCSLSDIHQHPPPHRKLFIDAHSLVFTLLLEVAGLVGLVGLVEKLCMVGIRGSVVSKI